jgi:hypothetical protein
MEDPYAGAPDYSAHSCPEGPFQRCPRSGTPLATGTLVAQLQQAGQQMGCTWSVAGCTRAVAATGGDLERAVGWCFSHQTDLNFDQPPTDTSTAAPPSSSQQQQLQQQLLPLPSRPAREAVAMGWAGLGGSAMAAQPAPSTLGHLGPPPACAAPHPTAMIATATAATTATTTATGTLVAQLQHAGQRMGCTWSVAGCTRAVAATDGDLERAVGWCLSHQTDQAFNVPLPADLGAARGPGVTPAAAVDLERTEAVPLHVLSMNANALLQGSWAKRDAYTFGALIAVEDVSQPALVRRYHDYKAKLAAELGDGDPSSTDWENRYCQLLFHGCSEEALPLIAREGFRADKQKTAAGSWQRFGPGFYFGAPVLPLRCHNGHTYITDILITARACAR